MSEEISIEKAEKAIQTANKIKLKACEDEISKVLIKHGMTLKINQSIVILPMGQTNA